MANGTNTDHEQPHDRHGNSPAAWTGVAIIAAASVVAGLAVVFGNWVLFFCAAVGGTLLGVIVWKLMGDAEHKRADGGEHGTAHSAGTAPTSVV